MQATIFERFFKENYSKIYYLALSLVHDDEVARDIVADSFEYLFSHHAELQEAEACNYLFVIVRNRCSDFFRKQAVHQRYFDYVSYTAEKVEGADWLEHDDKVETIRRLLEHLTPRTREVLEAHYLQGKKYSEVAAELEISKSAVKKHVMQALKLFREKLNKDDWKG